MHSLACILIDIFPLIACWYNMLQCDFSRTKHLRRDFSNKKSQQLGYIVWRSFAHTSRFWNVTTQSESIGIVKTLLFFLLCITVCQRDILFNLKWISELMERLLSVVPTLQEAIWNSSIHGICVHEVGKTFVFFHRSQKCWLAFTRLQFSWLYA